MPGTQDPFAGADTINQESQKALLDSIATGGAAGKKAYEDAQAEVASNRQGALNRAMQRQQITGQNLGGEDTQRVNATADRFGNALASGNANFQQNMQGIGASGQSFLQKVGAISPLIQSENLNKAAQRENDYKSAIAAAQERADAAAQAKQDQQNFELMKLGITEGNSNSRAQNAIDAANARANRTTSTGATNNVTLPQLVGMATQQPKILNDSGNILGSAVGGENIRAAQLGAQAGDIGRSLGVPETKLAGLNEPGFQNSLTKDLTKVNPGPSPKDYTAGNQNALKAIVAKNPTAALGQADAIAQKTGVNGGADIVKEIMSTPKVQSDLGKYYQLSALSGKNAVSWPQALAALQKDYLTPNSNGHHVPQDRTYAVMVELLRDLPWKT
jgi:hypothetical protein